MSSAVATGLLVLLGWIASSRGAPLERSSAGEPHAGTHAGSDGSSTGIEIAAPRGVTASPLTAELHASRARARRIELDRARCAAAGSRAGSDAMAS